MDISKYESKDKPTKIHPTAKGIFEGTRPRGESNRGETKNRKSHVTTYGCKT